MAQLTQDNRLLSISSPLPKDELLLTSFTGTETVSELFEFEIEVLSKNHSIKAEDLIGKPVTVKIQNDQQRTFNGFVSRFAYGEVKAENLRLYRMTMVPWLWFLTKTRDNRIFQEMTSKDIVSQVFKDLGFNDFDYKASGNPAVREYCVQYNESDFDFVSRLLEEDGIAYYFEQKKDAHVMHIVDAQNAYQTCKETDLEYTKGDQPNAQINSWEHFYEFRKGQWSLNDYDFLEPTRSQLQTTASTSKFANAKKYEHYEYTTYYDFGGIKDLTKKRIEAEEAPMDTIAGASDCSSFYAGGKFNLARHAVKQEKGAYILLSVRHRAVDNSYLAGHEDESDYSNQFLCIPEKVHFRPPLVRSKPYMNGPQSATVVGPGGEEIYIDEHGRIKVQFHWDREGKKDENSSCFIRVMQPWAGPGWGTSFIPRIGMEVVVNFFDGDPDRPIVTGSVYNGDNRPPFEAKTQSGIRTRSSKGGANNNANELRFEDSKDAEQIFIHAERNMDTEVENDESLSVDNNRSKIIGNDETSEIKHDRAKTVGNDQSENIGKDKTIEVGNNHTEAIGNNKSVDVSKNHNETIGANMSLTVTDNMTESVGKKIDIDAGDQIVLRTGSATITMKSSGDITISGKNITVKGSGKIDVKASSNVNIKGSKVSTN